MTSGKNKMADQRPRRSRRLAGKGPEEIPSKENSDRMDNTNDHGSNIGRKTAVTRVQQPTVRSPRGEFIPQSRKRRQLAGKGPQGIPSNESPNMVDKPNAHTTDTGRTPAANSPIAVNHLIPDTVLTIPLPNKWGPRQISYRSLHSLLAGRKVILFGLPGYHPPPSAISLATNQRTWTFFLDNRILCSARRFLAYSNELKELGVDEVLFITVNPQLVGIQPNRKAAVRVRVVAEDWDAPFSRAIGLENNILESYLPSARTRRFVILVDNCKVKFADLELGDRKFTYSSAKDIIKVLECAI